MAESDLIQDMWAPLAHRPIMQGKAEGALAAPGWLPEGDVRRWSAYLVLRAMMDNTTRWHLAEDAARPNKADEWREYGDPAVFVERIAAGVLGEEQTIHVTGADVAIPAEPDLDPPPAPPPGLGADDGDAEDGDRAEHPLVAQLQAEVYEQAVVAWEARSRQRFDEWAEALDRLPRLERRQKRLREWAAAELLVDLMAENEREHIVPLGSGLYQLGWSQEKNRVTVAIVEPDVYFPVLDDAGSSSGYPKRVDLIWPFVAPAPENADDPEADEEEWVRRITYELVPRAEGQLAAEAHGMTLSPPAYHAEGDVWREVCLVSDETYPAGSFKLAHGPNEDVTYREELVNPDDPDPDAAETFLWNRRPVGLDFIPLTHVSHSPSTVHHYGRSPLLRSCQLLDEIAGADVEEALAARWSARPLVGVSGMAGKTEGSQVAIAPGDGLRLGPDGKVTKVDMAAGLPELGAYSGRLRKQASVVVSVPDGLVGRVDASEVPSGITLQLSFTPFQQSVLTARLARSQKLSLLLRMVQRISIQNDVETMDGDAEVYPASVHLGSFMPQDLSAHASMIAALLQAQAISQDTAIEMLVGLGLPIPDAKRELDRIRTVMADVADQITSATENPRLAARFLGYSDAELDDVGDDAPEGEDGGAPALPAGADGGGLLL